MWVSKNGIISKNLGYNSKQISEKKIAFKFKVYEFCIEMRERKCGL